MSKTLFDKIWEKHVITGEIGEAQLIYVDLHLIHEVTSPQPFDGLRNTNRHVRRPDLTFATMDHNVPTKDIFNVQDHMSRLQMDTLVKNTKEFGVPLASIGDDKQGIVHVVGPERGLTQPAKLIVCGDSHTATHGAFGAIAFGIGTSEVEHVLATQTIWQVKPRQWESKSLENCSKILMQKTLLWASLLNMGCHLGSVMRLNFTEKLLRTFQWRPV